MKTKLLRLLGITKAPVPTIDFLISLEIVALTKRTPKTLAEKSFHTWLRTWDEELKRKKK
jgi:hypothetical protein